MSRFLKYALVFLIVCFFVSCISTKHTFQYIETKSSNVKPQTNQNGERVFRYEDSLVVIDYNLWSDGGWMKFRVFNKTDDPIYINWQNSNFIFKGHNNEYWSNKVVTNRTAYSLGNRVSTASGESTWFGQMAISQSRNLRFVSDFSSITNEVSVTSKENPSIQIPPRSYNNISKFRLNFPMIKMGTEESLSYQEQDTPLLVRNYIAVSTDKEFKTQAFIDNDFWISSISTSIQEVKKPDFTDYPAQPFSFYNYHTEDKLQVGKTFGLFSGCAGVLVFSLAGLIYLME